MLRRVSGCERAGHRTSVVSAGTRAHASAALGVEPKYTRASCCVRKRSFVFVTSCLSDHCRRMGASSVLYILHARNTILLLYISVREEEEEKRRKKEKKRRKKEERCW